MAMPFFLVPQDFADGTFGESGTGVLRTGLILVSVWGLRESNTELCARAFIVMGFHRRTSYRRIPTPLWHC